MYVHSSYALIPSLHFASPPSLPLSSHGLIAQHNEGYAYIHMYVIYICTYMYLTYLCAYVETQRQLCKRDVLQFTCMPTCVRIYLISYLCT